MTKLFTKISLLFAGLMLCTGNAWGQFQSVSCTKNGVVYSQNIVMSPSLGINATVTGASNTSTTAIAIKASFAPDGISFMNINTVTVTDIAANAFTNCSNLTTVTFEGTTPPSLPAGGFSAAFPASVTTINVPSGSECTYNAAGYTLVACNNVVTSGDCGTNLTWEYTEGTHTLSISGSGAMEDYASAGAPWYPLHEDITTISLPNGITSIGAYAFEGCAISSITLPANVASIGNFAFQNCTALSQVTINKSDAVVSLSQSAAFIFMNCNNNQRMTGIVPYVLWNTYKNTSNWTSRFDFEPAMASGKCGAGGNNGDNLSWLYMNHTLTITGTGAMANYTSGTAPWNDLQSLIQTININSGVTSIGNYAFSGTNYASTIVTINGTTLTTIGEHAFENNPAISSITLPSSVNSIGTCAFKNCDALTSITIPSGVTTIAAETFLESDLLESVTFQGNITSIGNYAFQGCNALSTISLPNSLTTIGDAVFNGAAFASISIPSSVETIGQTIFHMCNGSGDGLTIVLPWTTIPDGIDERAFDQDPANAYESFTISIPDGAEICDYTDKFGTTKKVYKNSSEDNLTCDAQVVVNYNCGYYGDNLTWSYSDGVLTISGSGAMANYANNTVLPWITGGVAQQTDITSIVLPNGMTTIGDYAFATCSNLTSIVIPSSVETIGAGAFTNSGLTAVTIPASVTSIGMTAFFSCTNLSTVTLLGTTPPALDATMGTFTFYKAQNPVETFYVPEGSKATYLAANGWSAFLTDDNTKEVVAFADGENTTSKLTNGSHEMIIINRNVQRNGYLNTICLPFGMNETQIANSSLADAVIYEFSGVTQVDSDFELTLTPVTTIEAGKPYFFKYEMNEPMLTELIFRDVTVSTNEPQDVGPFNYFTLKGTLSTQEVSAGFNIVTSAFTLIYSMGAENTLYCINGGTQTVYPLRAYFDYTPSIFVINYAPAARISFGHNTATDVENVQDAAQGTKVIENGQVIIIRNGARYNVAGQLIK